MEEETGRPINVKAHHLAELWERARVKPQMVQNRCLAAHGWDATVREFCLEKGIVYQGFSLLRANSHVVHDPLVVQIAKRLGVTNEQVIFRFTMHIGIWPQTGTTDVTHMKADLAAPTIQLTDADIAAIHSVSALLPE